MNKRKLFIFFKTLSLGMLYSSSLSAMELPENISPNSENEKQKMRVDKFISAFSQQEDLKNLKITDMCNGEYVHYITIVGNNVHLYPLTKLSCSHITIQYSNIQQIPSELWNIPNIEGINIYQCSHLKSLGDIPQEYTSLKGLFIFGCPNFTELPNSIDKLTQLTEMVMLNVNLSELPESLLRLTSLASFRLNSPLLCHRIKEAWRKKTGREIFELTGYPSSTKGVVDLNYNHIKAYFEFKK